MAYKTHLKRKMETRHIRMISLGGVIGTGLFLSSGYTIHEAGPLGTVIAYLVSWRFDCVCGHALSRRAFSGYALYRCFSCLC